MTGVDQCRIFSITKKDCIEYGIKKEYEWTVQFVFFWFWHRLHKEQGDVIYSYEKRWRRQELWEPVFSLVRKSIKYLVERDRIRWRCIGSFNFVRHDTFLNYWHKKIFLTFSKTDYIADSHWFTIKAFFSAIISLGGRTAITTAAFSDMVR